MVDPTNDFATLQTRGPQEALAPPDFPTTDRPNQLPPPATASGSETQPVDAQVPPLAPSAAGSLSVPGYDLLQILGRGGMGVVYLARQQGLNRLVALKVVLSGSHAAADERQRFQREAEAIAHLIHPNIVQIYQIGDTENIPYFSLEYVPGGTLARRLNGTPLSPKAAAQLIEPLARAMHRAHEQGIIHRDLKPANILVVEGPGTPLASCTLKITDFGLAKKLDSTEGNTVTGAIMGTPSYMAPEQASGRIKELGPASDIYALGAILYELVTGRPPFKAATTWDTLTHVGHTEPVPPRQMQPTLPSDLETICLKCLEKNPARRYVSAQDFAEDLRAFQNGEPIRARAPGLVRQAWFWVRRHAVFTTSTMVVLLLLIMGCGMLFLNALEDKVQLARENARRAVEEKERADRSAAQAAFHAQCSLAERKRAEAARFAGMNLTGQRVVFVLDMSASMLMASDQVPDPGKWRAACAQVDAMMRGLPQLEKYQILGINDQAHWLFGHKGEWLVYDPQTTPDQVRQRLTEGSIHPEGGTDFHAAMEAAFSLRPHGLDTIYLFSDGLPNSGQGLSDSELKALGEKDLAARLGKHLLEKLRTEWNREVAGSRVRINTIGFYFDSLEVGAFLWTLARENEGSFVGMGKHH